MPDAEPTGASATRRGRILKLAAIGTAAGAFSGMFGVGGGTVIVPLLILWFGYGERRRDRHQPRRDRRHRDPRERRSRAPTATSSRSRRCVVAVPALAGVVAGAALQQRLPERAISLLFAALLFVIAVELAIP